MIGRLILIACLTTTALSQEAEPYGIPSPVDEENFEALKTQSPFTRVLDFSEAFALRGVAQIGNQSVARLYNRKNKKTVTVTETEANKLGMTLVTVNSNPENLENVSVRISVGGEEVDLHYDTNQIAPAPKEKPVYQKDSKGRPIPPKELIDNYRSMTSEQRSNYMRWRSYYYKKNPKLEHSEKRFPIVQKAINAIKAGKTPPK